MIFQWNISLIFHGVDHAPYCSMLQDRRWEISGSCNGKFCPTLHINPTLRHLISIYLDLCNIFWMEKIQRHWLSQNRHHFFHWVETGQILQWGYSKIGWKMGLSWGTGGQLYSWLKIFETLFIFHLKRA